jgi:hypothetical protein
VSRWYRAKRRGIGHERPASPRNPRDTFPRVMSCETTRRAMSAGIANPLRHGDYRCIDPDDPAPRVNGGTA